MHSHAPAGTSDHQLCDDPALLRPGKEWIGGAWRDRPGEPIPIRYVRAAEQARLANQDEQLPAAEPAPVSKPAAKAAPKPAGRQQQRQLKENSQEAANASGGEAAKAAAGGGAVMVRRSQRDRRERVIMVRV